MRISRKIGLGFFVTFFLVIILGILSIYSLRHLYKGMEEVFSKELPATRYSYQILASFEKLQTELNKFLITGNTNFKISYNRSYEKMRSSLALLEKFISKNGESETFLKLQELSMGINGLAGLIFEKKGEVRELFKKLRVMGDRYTKKLDKLFDFEEKRLQNETDLLLIQAKYIPAIELLTEVRLDFFHLLDNLTLYAIKGEEEVLASFKEDKLRLDKAIKDYRNFHGYSLSDEGRLIAEDLIALHKEFEILSTSIIDLEKEINLTLGDLFVKEKELVEKLDKILAFKKSGISSKLGIGSTLTEDIPAVHNVSRLRSDIAKSWRFNTLYIMSEDESYKSGYHQLRQIIDKALKDYDRHARLRGREEVFKDIVDKDKDILQNIDTNMAIFERKKEAFSFFVSTKGELDKKINALTKSLDAAIKGSSSATKVSVTLVPARWTLVRLKSKLTDSASLLLDYLNEKESGFKDLYSNLYFEMKKTLNTYRNYSISDEDKRLVEEIELGLDSFNKTFLEVIENHDKILKEEGWAIIEKEKDLEESLNNAIELEINELEQNKKTLTRRVATINTVTIFIIVVVALIAVFIVFYTRKSITDPILKLYHGAEVIGGGNLDHRLDIQTGDEIQELAEGFNKMAGELKELYTNLENKVKERTCQLAEANEALARINKELDDFTYIVSHDLKEPLRGVKAFTKLLVEDYSGRLGKEGKEYLATIQDSSARMTHLIEDLLNLSRIGRIKNIEPDVDMNGILGDVKKNLLYSLEEKKVDLKIPEDLPKLKCDRIRIAEVFTNLISNAIKYSKKDQRPVIEVGFKDKGDRFEFFVKDNGIGIEKEYYDKVFQIFRRLQAKGEAEGTGAGLTIVKKIVENHGGKIWVDSGVGVGSTFYFTLPKEGSKHDG